MAYSMKLGWQIKFKLEVLQRAIINFDQGSAFLSTLLNTPLYSILCLRANIEVVRPSNRINNYFWTQDKKIVDEDPNT